MKRLESSWHAMAGILLSAAMLGLVSPARGENESQPIRALLVIGGCCHDYPKQKDILTKGIAARANVRWKIAYDTDSGTRHKNPVYDDADWAKDFDVIVHDECCSDVTDLEIIDGILRPHREGLPAVVLHCGMHSYRSKGWPSAVTPWFAFTGLPSTGHGPQDPIAIAYIDTESPITKGLEDWTTVNEELYNNSAGKLLATARPLAHGRQTSKGRGGKDVTTDCVVVWTNTYQDKTKVFGTTLGHNNETVADGRYLDLVTRGLLWATGHLTAEGKPAAGYEVKK
jgi:type 1 glutamine amidotransferase